MLVSAIRCPAGDCKAICREGAQVLTAAIVVHSQHAELTGSTKGVGHKVQRPTLARTQSHWHQRARSPRTFAAPSPPDAKPFFSIEAIQLLVIHGHSFAFQQHANPAAAEPTPLAGNRLHLFVNFWIVGRTLTPDRLGIDTDKPARSAL
jgi:hypothetical protein